MTWPLIILGLAAGGCVALKGGPSQGKGDGSSPDAGSLTPDATARPTDVGKDANACPVGPQKFVGDGLHYVSVGDSIQVDNGIRFEVTGNWSYSLAGDFYAGTEKLNIAPYEASSMGLCSRAFGTLLQGGGLFDKADDCGRIPLSLTSLFKGPIGSRQELYDACMADGNSHGLCSDYIPYSAAPKETVFQDGKFKVFVSGSVTPNLGPFLLKQLKQCYAPVVNMFGLSETVPQVGLRWYFDDGGFYPTAYATDYQIHWPWVFDSAQVDETFKSGFWNMNDQGCAEPYVTHELSHLLRNGIYKPYYVEEGLAMLAEQELAAREFMNTPDFNGSAVVGDQWVPSDIKVKIKAINAPNQTVTVSIIYPYGFSMDYVLSANMFVTLSSSNDPKNTMSILAIGDIQPQKVDVKLYFNPPQDKIPWNVTTQCVSGGYVGNWLGLKIDGMSYTYYFNKDETVATPFTSLIMPDDSPGGYTTGLCFWKGLMTMYGENVVKDFLATGDKVRQKNLKGIPEKFCWSKSLSDACGGANLGSYFAAFDLPYEVTDCAAMGGGEAIFDSTAGTWSCE